jgi:hypothetical protein
MREQSAIKEFFGFSVKAMILQTVTYFAFGLIMSNLFNYKEIFELPIIKDFMRPLDSPYVLAGPFLQPIRGFLLALVIWPIRNIFLERKHGALILWSIFLVFGILATPAAAPCSIEGVIYSKLPLWFHCMGLIEITLQTLSFSFLLIWWTKKSQKEEVAEVPSKPKEIFQRIMFAVMISCFAYIGYAVGSILSAKVAGRHIHLDGAAVDLRGQLTFVVAFIINVIAVLILISKSYFGRITLLRLFLIFWLLDSASVLIYRWLVFGHMPIHLSLIIGFFPAVIILLSYKANYKNLAKLNNISPG